MSDYIVRATAKNAQVRAFAATTRELTEYARNAHGTSPVATAALGRLLTAGAMMGTMLKSEKDLLTLQIKGDGPMRGVTVTADCEANVKGYVDVPVFEGYANAFGKLDVGGAIGYGTLTVIRDLGLKEPYVGQTALHSGEIAEDLTYYFATSEQIPSTVGLGVLMEKNNTVKQAGGFIIQLMPFAEDEVITQIENNLSKFSSVTTFLEEGKTPEEMLEFLLDGLDMEIVDKVPTKFRCNCDRKRIEKALISVGSKELKAMIDDGEEIEVNCHFCNTHYKFSIDELKELLKRAK